MIGRNFITGLAACVVSFSVPLSATAQGSAPIVFAHYMPGYSLGNLNKSYAAMPASAEGNMLSWPTSVQQNSEWFAPDLNSLAGSGMSATAKEFDLAQSAGVNAFGVLLSSGSLSRSDISHVLDNQATSAEQGSVKLIPEIWCDPYKDNYALFGSNLKQFEDSHPSAFLTQNGKPIIVFYFTYSDANNTDAQQQAALSSVQKFLAPWGGINNVYTIFYLPYQTDIAQRSPLVSAASAVDVWTPQDDWSSLHSVVSASVGQKLNKDVVWPVSPAFYQRRTGALPWEYGDSLGAARYIDAWMNATLLQPLFIDIQTWNDFSEDSAIVPTNAAGSTLLDLTAYFTQWIDSGSAPQVTTEKVMLFRQKQLVSAKLSNPAGAVTNASWRHATPTVDYVDTVTLLKSPAQVVVSVGGAQWKQQMPAGLHEFLIYAPNTAQAGKGGVTPNANSFPSNSSYRTVITTSGFSAATPQVQVIRNGSAIATLKSKIPFLNSGAFQDLTLIGDETTVGR